MLCTIPMTPPQQNLKVLPNTKNWSSSPHRRGLNPKLLYPHFTLLGKSHGCQRSAGHWNLIWLECDYQVMNENVAVSQRRWCHSRSAGMLHAGAVSVLIINPVLLSSDLLFYKVCKTIWRFFTLHIYWHPSETNQYKEMWWFLKKVWRSCWPRELGPVLVFY